MKKLITLIFTVIISCTQSQNKQNIPLSYVDSTRVKNDLITITQTEKSRSYQHIKTLDTVAAYIDPS